MTLSIIQRSEVERALPIERCLEMARVAYRALADGRALESSLGHVSTPDGEFLVKSSGLVVGNRLFVAVKVVAYFASRMSTLGLPNIVGLLELFDGETGEPLALMESGLITNLRTAAGTAVALDSLARNDASRLLVCGTGAQLLSHVEAIASVRDLSVVRVWGRHHDRAQTAALELRAYLPHLPIEPVIDVSEAAMASDLIVCITAATEPYLDLEDVSPGTTIAAVGSDSPSKQELSVELLASSAIICDVSVQCAMVGELRHALDAKVISMDDVRAEIGQVLLGSGQGRMSRDEIVIFDSTGTAVQDTAPAAAAFLASRGATQIDLW